MSQVDEIKSRLSIESYIGTYVTLKREGRGFTGLCPFHTEKHPSFKVDTGTQSWRCYGSCAEGGDIFSFAQKYHHYSFPEVLQELADLAGVILEKQKYSPKPDNSLLYAILEAACVFYHDTLLKSQEGLNYLHSRAYTDKTISEWKLGLAPKGFKVISKHLEALGYSEDEMLKVGLIRDTEKYGRMDTFTQRLMIPIRDEMSRVVGFGGRALAEQKAKHVEKTRAGVAKILESNKSLNKIIETGMKNAEKKGKSTSTAVHTLRIFESISSAFVLLITVLTFLIPPLSNLAPICSICFVVSCLYASIFSFVSFSSSATSFLNGENKDLTPSIVSLASTMIRLDGAHSSVSFSSACLAMFLTAFISSAASL